MACRTLALVAPVAFSGFAFLSRPSTLGRRRLAPSCLCLPWRSPLRGSLGVWPASAVAARPLFAQAGHEAPLEHEAPRACRDHLHERVRIGGELQDIIAHSVSAMVIQAGGARRLLRSDPERARDSILNVEHTGREALADLRRLLGMLRGDEDQRALCLLGRARPTREPARLDPPGRPGL